MSDKRKLKVEDVFYANLNPHDQRRKMNHLMERISREKASTDALHGDGLFPVSKDVNGKVEAGTGLQVIIKDYIGLIDGYQVYLESARIINANKTQTLAITKTGEFYIGLELDGNEKVTYTDDDDTEEVEAQNAINNKYGKLPKHGCAVPVEIDVEDVVDNGGVVEAEGKIILAKMNVPEEATQITVAMIDNTVKDYLVDIDVLRRDVAFKMNEVAAELYQEIVDAIDALKAEIANGDQDVLDTVNAKIATINGNITNIQTEIDTLKVNVTDLAEYVSDILAPRVDQLSADLNTAVVNLVDLITNETILLNVKIEENLNKLGLLQTEVEAPTTGLLDRVETLEKQPTIPAELLAMIADHEARISELESGSQPSPTIVNHLVVSEDIDGSSTYSIDALGNMTLPVNTEAPNIVQDTFDVDGAIDDAKWTVLGLPYQESGLCNLNHNNSITSIEDSINIEVAFDCVMPSEGSDVGQTFYTMVRFDSATSTWYNVALLPVLGATYSECKLYKYVNGSKLAVVTTRIDKLVAGTTYSVKISAINNVIKVSVDDVEQVNIVDENIGGVAYISSTGKVRFQSYRELWKIDNVNVIDPTIGIVYETSGVILTTQLESVSPILEAFIQGNVTVPEDTTITYEVSLNGGTNWVTVTLDELIDGLDAPWNGVGTDYRVKITLATTDTSKTPLIELIRAISQK